MNRVMPAHHRQKPPSSSRDPMKLNQEERQQASPTPIVQDLLFLKESGIQLPDTELPNDAVESSPVTSGGRKSYREDDIESRRKSEQPVFKVKNNEPAPQFYYQPPTVIQQEYVYHIQKEEPSYMMRNTFLPVQQQQERQKQKGPNVAPKPAMKRVHQNHTFVSSDETNSVNLVKPEALYQRPPRFSEPLQDQQQQQEFHNYDDYLNRVDILYPAPRDNKPPEQIDRIPLKDAPGESSSYPFVEPVEVYPQSKPPTPPPLPPAASTPSSTFTSRGMYL